LKFGVLRVVFLFAGSIQEAGRRWRNGSVWFGFGRGGSSGGYFLCASGRSVQQGVSTTVQQ
jgi:hypothetical protein